MFARRRSCCAFVRRMDCTLLCAGASPCMKNAASCRSPRSSWSRKAQARCSWLSNSSSRLQAEGLFRHRERSRFRHCPANWHHHVSAGSSSARHSEHPREKASFGECADLSRASAGRFRAGEVMADCDTSIRTCLARVQLKSSSLLAAEVRPRTWPVQSRRPRARRADSRIR